MPGSVNETYLVVLPFQPSGGGPLLAPGAIYTNTIPSFTAWPIGPPVNGYMPVLFYGSRSAAFNGTSPAQDPGNRFYPLEPYNVAARIKHGLTGGV